MSDFTTIGITNWRSQQKVFGIKDHDRLGHIYCIGKTGSGKSTLLLNMAIADIQRGKGVGIIDPHGDLAEELLHHIPQERVHDVLYFNTTDEDYVIPFSPLAHITNYNRYITSETIVTTLKKLWSDSWGPRLEHILRNTLLSLSYYSRATLLDIVPMLTDYEFRKTVLYAVPENSLHEFWRKEFEPLSPQLKNEFIAPITNKVGLFTEHPQLKLIFGQASSSFTIAEVMNRGMIFIANLSKGVLGETASQLLGSLLVTQFQVAALGRATVPKEERRPFYLFIDEVHSFMTLSFADILSEARKYGLGLFITHQYIEQLDEEVRNAIFGNVGTMISFRVGNADAKVLAEEFSPVFSEEDLISLQRYHVYIKLLIDGTTSKPFSAITAPLLPYTTSCREHIEAIARKFYGMPKEEVVNQIDRDYKVNTTENAGRLF